MLRHKSNKVQAFAVKPKTSRNPASIRSVWMELSLKWRSRKNSRTPQTSSFHPTRMPGVFPGAALRSILWDLSSGLTRLGKVGAVTKFRGALGCAALARSKKKKNILQDLLLWTEDLSHFCLVLKNGRCPDPVNTAGLAPHLTSPHICQAWKRVKSKLRKILIFN